MKTPAEEYKEALKKLQDGTIKELTQLPSDEPRFIIDSNTREITIPEEFTFLGVKNDANAETIYFEIDRYFDTEDLSKHTIAVQYTDTSKKVSADEDIPMGMDAIIKIDIDTVPGKIIFGWTIKHEITYKATSIAFAIRIFTLDEKNRFKYSFNTLTSVLPVYDTLDITGASAKRYANILDEWLAKMSAIEKKIMESDIDVTKKRVDALEESQTKQDEQIENANNRINQNTSTIGNWDSEFNSDTITSKVKQINDTYVTKDSYNQLEKKVDQNTASIGNTEKFIGRNVGDTIGNWNDTHADTITAAIDVIIPNVAQLQLDKADKTELPNIYIGLTQPDGFKIGDIWFATDTD